MHPLLFEIPLFGGIRIYAYGVLVAAAFVTGVYWTVHEAKVAKVKPELILDLSFYIILSALAGSRILYILVDWQRYVEHPFDILKIWEGGLVFYGGLIAAIITSIVYLRRHNLRFLKVADLFVPGVALGHSIGRLGCFAAGCCYGREEPHFLLSIKFPHIPYSLAPAGVSLFPSQLAESLAAFLIFLLLIAFRRRKKFEGQIFLIYLLVYSMARSILEIFRGDSIRGYIVPDRVTTSQFISGIFVLIVLVIYYWLRKRGGRILQKGEIGI